MPALTVTPSHTHRTHTHRAHTMERSPSDIMEVRSPAICDYWRYECFYPYSGDLAPLDGLTSLDERRETIYFDGYRIECFTCTNYNWVSYTLYNVFKGEMRYGLLECDDQDYVSRLCLPMKTRSHMSRVNTVMDAERWRRFA